MTQQTTGQTPLFQGVKRANKANRLTPIAVACCLTLFTTGFAFATPLTLSQIPAGNGSRQPAPNVIVTIDDSGSMNEAVSATDSNSKISLIRQSLQTQFGDGTANSGKIPDGRIRLAWQSMWDNGYSMSGRGARSIKLGATNSMRSFEGTQRVNFNAFVNSLTAGNGTPSHQMMKNVFNYMNAPENIGSPWADVPGTAQTSAYKACRRTYHVFMTDGAWNNRADTDRVSKGDYVTQTLPDGVSYDKDSAQTKVYSDPYGENVTGKASTLSDFAFRGWATDLQSGAAGTTQTNSAGTSISGNTQNMVNGNLGLKPLIKFSGVENVYVGNTAPTICNAANKCTPLAEYWNPKNDPATWQHINQYSIGFGTGALTWGSAPYFSPTKNNFGYDGDYPKLVNGGLASPDGVRWPDPLTSDTGTPDSRTAELWHMAINGRGRFYPADSAEALTAAFADILDTIVGDTDTNLVSIAASTSYLRSGLDAYLAGYNPVRYSGTLSARPIDATTGAIGATETWNAGDLLDASSITSRVVLSYSGSAGIAWKTYTALPAAQKTPLNKNSAGTVDSKGQERVDYLRGDRSQEAPSGAYRQRDSRLGDIVNSNIWYTGKPASGYTQNGYATFRGTGTGGQGNRTPMLYVGANDGMLHGVAATTGVEKLAYIPQGIAEGNLRKLTDTTYTHQYFVDGAPFTGDAYIGTTPAWATVLVGGLGAGGKGYFLLDVTDPSQFTDANAATVVIADTTATTDADIGTILSPPVMDDTFANRSRQIVKMNNGRWAVVMGNGYNSTNEAPVLIIQYLDGNKAMVKISPCSFPTTGACSFKGTNGLSTPQVIDLDGNGTADVAYAGDLQGNVWKFDLTSATDTSWGTSFSGQPFFVAKNGTTTQSITAAPFWKPHPLGGVMLAIATGRNLTDADQSDTVTQTIYGLYDNSRYTVASGIVTITDATAINTTASTSQPSTLVQQVMTATAVVDLGTNYFTTTNNPVDYKGNPLATPVVPAKRGWYLNLPLSGQRVVQNMRAFSGEKFLIQSLIPKTGGNSTVESCSPSPTAERAFQTVLNLFGGAPPETPTFTLAQDAPDASYMVNGRDLVTTVEGVAGDTSLIYTENTAKLLSSNCKIGTICNAKDFNIGKFVGKRAGWRQVQ